MNHNQFKTYLHRLFYQSIYNYNIKEDTNQMSEIDFCVCLTEKNINTSTKKYEQSVSKLQKEFHEYEEKYNKLVRIENKNIQEEEVTKFLNTGRSIKRKVTLLNLNIKKNTIDDTIKKKLISQTKTIFNTTHRYNMAITLKFTL